MKNITTMTELEILDYLRDERKCIVPVSYSKEYIENLIDVKFTDDEQWVKYSKWVNSTFEVIDEGLTLDAWMLLNEWEDDIKFEFSSVVTPSTTPVSNLARAGKARNFNYPANLNPRLFPVITRLANYYVNMVLFLNQLEPGEALTIDETPCSKN